MHRILPYLCKVLVRRHALQKESRLWYSTSVFTKRANYKGESHEMDVLIKVYKVKLLPVLPTSGTVCALMISQILLLIVLILKYTVCLLVCFNERLHYMFLLKILTAYFCSVIGQFSPLSSRHWMQEKNPTKCTWYITKVMSLFPKVFFSAKGGNL